MLKSLVEKQIGYTESTIASQIRLVKCIELSAACGKHRFFSIEAKGQEMMTIQKEACS
jgi:hypothetical protein